MEEILANVPQAVVRVDARLVAHWIEPTFISKTGLVLQEGQCLLDVLELGRHRDELEHAVRRGQRYAGSVITCALQQVRLKVQPCGEDHPKHCWIILEPGGIDDPVAFAQALQEMARAVSEVLDVEAVCAASVMAMVRCANVSRAEVFLVGETGLRRVAISDVAGSGTAREKVVALDATLKQALTTGEPQIGIARAHGSGSSPVIFAALPLLAPKRTLGLLLLHKGEGAAFSSRELDLWRAAAGQLAVGIDNARLFREAQSALRARDEFMSIASHELRTPLTPLKMSLYMMERKITADEPVALATVIKSKRQVDRLAKLVTDLLDASRAEMGRLEVRRQPLDLGQLVVEVVEQFRGTYERPVHLNVPPDRLWIQGDRDRLEQVLVNLLENAHKYSPQGAPVEVELDLDPDAVRVSVMDRGIGIPLEDQERIFERFHRAQNVTERSYSGLGLGLYISDSIIRLHHGRLAVTSAEGEGSTFTVWLPRLSPEQRKGLPRRALLLEQDVEQRAAATELLVRLGFEVVGPDAGEALRNLVTQPVDVILGSSTLEAAAHQPLVQTLSALVVPKRIPLILAGAALPDWAAGHGAILCPKPYSLASLSAALQKVLEGEPSALPPQPGIDPVKPLSARF